MKVYIVLLDENEPYGPGRTEILAVLDSKDKAEQCKKWLEDQVEWHYPNPGPNALPEWKKPFSTQKYHSEYLGVVEKDVE